MIDDQWEIQCYILDLAKEDPLFRDAQHRVMELYEPFYDFVSRQPEDVQDLLHEYVQATHFQWQQLFSLACRHLQLPSKSDP